MGGKGGTDGRRAAALASNSCYLQCPHKCYPLCQTMCEESTVHYSALPPCAVDITFVNGLPQSSVASSTSTDSNCSCGNEKETIERGKGEDQEE